MKYVIGFILVPLVLIATVSFASAQGSSITVTSPRLRWDQESPIIGLETAFVWANVTSNYRIKNATLYYIAIPQAQCCGVIPQNEKEYSSVAMSPRFGNASIGTYEAMMPTVANDTKVWGFTKAYDIYGNFGKSDTGFIYYRMAPNPNTSYLSFDFYVRHIDPKTLGINLTIDASLNNAYTYSPELLNVPGEPFSIAIATPVSKYTFTSQQTERLFYTGGHPELYPFDGYNYTFVILLPKYANKTRLSVNGQQLIPGIPYDLITPQAYTQGEALDNSLWIVSSRVFFTSSNNELQIGVVINRVFEQVEYQLLLPVVSLYILLVCSVFLRGKDELANRLLVYLTIFLFSYGFQSNLRSLSMTPIVFGFSMIDRMILALIPLTVVLSVESIIMRVAVHWPDDNIHLSGKSTIWATVVDVGALGVCVTLFYFMTTVTVNIWHNGWIPITYSILNMGLWGSATLLVLIIGFLLNLALLLWQRLYK